MNTTTPASQAVSRPIPRCPRHKVPLDGGPVRFICREGHGVPAADIDHEYHAPGEVTR